MRVAIVVPTFNRKKLLLELLESIAALQIPENTEVLTIVVVDGSNDGTVESLSRLSDFVHVVHGDGTWWWTKSVNCGIEKAISLDVTHVLLMNDDNILPENYLVTLLGDSKKLPNQSVLGSASISISTSNTIDAAGYYKFNKILFKLYPYRKSGTMVDQKFKGVHKSCALSGRGTLIPIAVLNKVGLLDESLIQYGSDDDFTMRCVDNNIPVFISWNAHVLNYTEITSKERNLSSVTFKDLIKAYFNPFSSSSLKKEYILYSKHSNKIFAPLYCSYLFAAGILLHIRNRFIFTA
jgi:GT2 family glycosyltransferase